MDLTSSHLSQIELKNKISHGSRAVISVMVLMVLMIVNVYFWKSLFPRHVFGFISNVTSCFTAVTTLIGQAFSNEKSEHQTIRTGRRLKLMTVTQLLQLKHNSSPHKVEEEIQSSVPG